MAREDRVRVGPWLLLGKLATKLFPALLKLLALIFKTKVGLAAVSFIGWTSLFSWQFALVIMISIGIHEAGHVWAMRRFGIPTRGFYFIPFLGGAAVPLKSFTDQWQHLCVALMGPVWGSLVGLAAALVYIATGNPLWAGIAAWIVLINLVNLIPVYPLDGGRVMHSMLVHPSFPQLVRPLYLMMFVFLGAVAYLGAYTFLAIGLVGIFELWMEAKNRRQLVAEQKSAQQSVDQFRREFREKFQVEFSDFMARLESGQETDPTAVGAYQLQRLLHQSEAPPENPRLAALYSEGVDMAKLINLSMFMDVIRFEQANLQTIEQKMEDSTITPLGAAGYAGGIVWYFGLALTLAAALAMLAQVEGAGAALKAIQ